LNKEKIRKALIRDKYGIIVKEIIVVSIFECSATIKLKELIHSHGYTLNF
jgi:hypothetical protein